jgi:hypothetical protein
MKYLDAQRVGDCIHVVRTFINVEGVEQHQEIIMPHDTLSIRAGEYGLHPVDDAEAVWDMILHEPMLEGEDVPLIVTAPTLEHARDEHLARCRAARDEHYTRSGGRLLHSRAAAETHVDVLDSLKVLGTADVQLSILVRGEMKRAVKAERLRQGAPTLSRKTKLIDQLREREGI